MVPTEQEFLALARQGNLIPVYEEILGDCETPVSAYLKLCRSSEYAFLLESVEGGETVCRFSFIAKDPELIFQVKGSQAQFIFLSSQKPRVQTLALTQNPLAFAENFLKKYRFVPVPGVPKFCGGFLGYFGYDTVRYFEKLPKPPHDDLTTPDILLALVHDLVVFDHRNHKIKILTNVFIDDAATVAQKRKAYRLAQQRIARTQDLLRSQTIALASKRPPKRSPVISPHSNLSKKQFQQAVSAAKRYIQQGDIIQVVLSQRFHMPISTHPFNIYRSLRTINPSPYMYFLKFQQTHLVGSSPEMLVRLENQIAETRPIAGTRPRGKDSAHDLALAKELWNDPKERAEHVMLVDLGRNDLGRVCAHGSVKVCEFMAIEHYSHVMHLVSKVQGILAKGKTSSDVLAATFPAGTVSGAPKIRAMEIIDELEPTARGPYAGAVGYLGFTNNLDTCITIRTILIQGKTAYFQAGAGIVADSHPQREYAETVNKAQSALLAIQTAHQQFA